ncbi:hypothetical protein DFH08DRAFT_886264 [Mycena albidolilacea]|uniref:Uncharacterized protein n=1 Tax=Mycena albidolilacea TaxID=1033008 RepID=A0AAD6ZJ95_9AGAR|nr:hypothetical protein DFH08DRAFT_886264 [Mycena albidolilacea]
MFILAAHASPFSAVAPSAFALATSPLRLSLTLLATFLIFALIRRVLAAGRPALSLPLAEKRLALRAPVVVEKKSDVAPSSRTWFGLFSFSSEAAPAPAPDSELPTPLSRHTYPKGVRRPEPAFAARPRIEAPLPAIYECPTPLSMAKLIMSRHHTQRRPAHRARASV